MNTNILEIANISGLANLDQCDQQNEAIRELADAELFMVGGGSGEVSWNTPNPPTP